MMIPPIVISFRKRPSIDKDPMSDSINNKTSTDDSGDMINTFFELRSIEMFFVLVAIIFIFVDAKLNKIINKYIFII